LGFCGIPVEVQRVTVKDVDWDGLVVGLLLRSGALAGKVQGCERILLWG
jgi:hypothetical protein